MGMGKDIASPQTLSTRVDAYLEAVKKIEAAYALLDEAQSTLRGAFDEYLNVIPYHAADQPLETLKKAREEIKRRVWRRLIDLSQVRKVMSVKRAEDLDQRLEKGQLEEITHASVLGMISLLRDQTGDFAKEAVCEVYDFLRPNPNPDSRQYKTNSGAARWRLGKKVILSWIVEEGYSSYMRVPAGDGDRKLRAVDRVFHLLDGKGVPEGYLCPLIDAINSSPDGLGETDYFRFRACKNRNLHLEFKRPDLVTQFNRIAGGGNILHD